MPKILKQTEIDPINEAVDIAMTAAEEAAEMRRFAPSGTSGDLSDGGKVNGATLTPMSNGVKMQQGRANARQAWSWNGSETLLPLAWNPDGTRHDGGRPYLLKRYCLCCGTGGFRGPRCLNCVKNACTRCNGSQNSKKIIPLNYLKKEDVPFPARFYGDIPCFLPQCIRREDRGFKTEEEMRMHARSRHKMEYQAHQETMTASRSDELAQLRARLDAMTVVAVAPTPEKTGMSPEKREAFKARMAKSRAARESAAASATASPSN